MLGVLGEIGVDWRFVRTSSSGETNVLIAVRAIIPADKGVRDGWGMRGGRRVFTRWS